MRNVNILWADDEIDLLHIHVMFLRQKGHNVVTTNNGADAVELVKTDNFDIIFLDENMPGMSGLTALNEIKKIKPSIPVVMITKSEEEDIMDQAIGSKMADYLIKPVNPNQILLSIKKNVDLERLVTQKTTADYQQEFRQLSMQINECRKFDDWVDVYKKLVYWELELAGSNDNMMDEVLKMQKIEANAAFCKYIKNNYISWFDPKSTAKPLISPMLFKQRVAPLLKAGEKVFFIVVDNLRYDQWKVIQPMIEPYMRVETEELYCSILPTATQYARNAIFSGLMPSEIDKIFPDIWLNDSEEGGKNMYEKELMQKQIQRMGLNVKYYYDKINTNKAGKKLVDNFKSLKGNQLNVVVFNFIDMLSHARTEMEMIRELAANEAAYRSLTQSWMEHSPLLDLIKELASEDFTIILTTDHGTVRVNNPIKVIGDRETSTNLRYKQGRNLAYNAKEVFEITNPGKAFLPITNLSSTYIFACNDDFLAYPNNFHYYVKYYKDTFQHGGVSLEEMLVPIIKLVPKK